MAESKKGHNFAILGPTEKIGVRLFLVLMLHMKGLRALRPFFGPHLRSKYESGNKSISLHDFIRPIFLVFHFGFSLDLAVH